MDYINDEELDAIIQQAEDYKVASPSRTSLQPFHTGSQAM